MQEKIKVSVETTHFHQEDKEVFSHVGEGRYFFKRGQHFVEYKVFEEGREARFLLKFDDKELALTKTSEQGRYMMELWENGRTKFNYQTPFGIIQVHIIVKNLKIEIEESNIIILAKYDLLSDGEENVVCEMKITVNGD